MKKRLSSFEDLKNDPWFGRLFKKLTAAELKICREFIVKHKQSPRGDFELAINRLFLDRPDKPKHWPIICDLLCASYITADD